MWLQTPAHPAALQDQEGGPLLSHNGGRLSYGTVTTQVAPLTWCRDQWVHMSEQHGCNVGEDEGGRGPGDQGHRQHTQALLEPPHVYLWRGEQTHNPTLRTYWHRPLLDKGDRDPECKKLYYFLKELVYPSEWNGHLWFLACPTPSIKFVPDFCCCSALS